MSRTSLEFYEAFVEAWNAGDMAAVRELHDPDVVLRTVGDWPEQGPCFGREAVMRWYAQVADPWASLRLEVISLTVLSDRVLVRQSMRAVGRGPDWEIEFTGVSMLRDGKVVFVELFWDHEEAMAALALPA